PGRSIFPRPSMSDLYDRLKRLFDRGHDLELSGLRTDASFAPPVSRPAAVLIAVTDRPRPGVILTHRPASMRAHPGQVAFPGGSVDPGEDAVRAALREAHEELSIDGSAVRVIGTSDRYLTGSGYDVTPVLGVVPPDLPLSPIPPKWPHGSKRRSISCSTKATTFIGKRSCRGGCGTTLRSIGKATASGE